MIPADPEPVRSIVDPLVIAALAGAFATVLAAITTAAISVLGAIKRTNIKLDDAKTTVAESDRKKDQIVAAVNEVKQLANGNLDQMRKDLLDAHERLRISELARHEDRQKLFQRYGIDRRKSATKKATVRR